MWPLLCYCDKIPEMSNLKEGRLLARGFRGFVPWSLGSVRGVLVHWQGETSSPGQDPAPAHCRFGDQAFNTWYFGEHLRSNHKSSWEQRYFEEYMCRIYTAVRWCLTVVFILYFLMANDTGHSFIYVFADHCFSYFEKNLHAILI